jgi:hypothetical protein
MTTIQKKDVRARDHHECGNADVDAERSAMKWMD